MHSVCLSIKDVNSPDDALGSFASYRNYVIMKETGVEDCIDFTADRDFAA